MLKPDAGYAYVEDDPSLLRDRYSKGLVNTDMEALHAYKKQREHRRATSDLSERVDAIEQKLDMMIEKLDRLFND